MKISIIIPCFNCVSFIDELFDCFNKIKTKELELGKLKQDAEQARVAKEEIEMGKQMKKYKAKLIAVEANETILVDKQKTIEYADKNNIVVMAV